MSKAIMIMSAQNAASIANGQYCTLIGTGSINTTDANSRVSATEEVTFSKLRMSILSGGSGTNSLRFRDNGVNGNQLATLAGTGIAEDTSNTDVVAAGDTFNLAYTDTGTDSVFGAVSANVEFASGHGCFHGSAHSGGTIHDVASATRYLNLEGNRAADGETTEATQGWKCRGYTHFVALQTRCSANARTNTSTFKNRIASADGTGSCAYAAGATGLVTSTGLADTIADGDIINASLTLDTGVQDLTVNLVVATLKNSTAGKQDRWAQVKQGLARAASATPAYVTVGGAMTGSSATESDAQVPLGFAGQASNLRVYVGANTYTGDATLKLMQNGSAVMTATITASAANQWFENTSDTITFDDNDTLSLELDEGTSGSATFYMAGFTISPVSGTGGFDDYYSPLIGRIGGGSV